MTDFPIERHTGVKQSQEVKFYKYFQRNRIWSAKINVYEEKYMNLK